MHPYWIKILISFQRKNAYSYITRATAIWSQGLHQKAAWIMFQDGTESCGPMGHQLTFEHPQKSEQTLWSSRRAIEVLAALTLLPWWLYTSLELSVIWLLWQSSTTGPPQGLINAASQGTCHWTDNRERTPYPNVPRWLSLITTLLYLSVFYNLVKAIV